MRSFQGMYLKFAENVDILVNIDYAKFYYFYLYTINLAESGNSHNSEINLTTSLWFDVCGYTDQYINWLTVGRIQKLECHNNLVF